MSTVQEMTPDLRSRPVMQTDEFVYRPMPTLVPISMAFVFLSLLAGLSDLLLVIPLLGALISFIAYYQIARSRGELSGSVISQVCLLMTLFMFTGFGALHFNSYITEVPKGYSRVNFTNDISKKGFETINGQLGIHPDVAKLSDKPIYLKGYMFPFRETRGLKSFILCKDSGECCFGGQPKPTDMILINMVNGTTVNYHEKQLVGVAGTLRVEPKYDATGLTPVYQLDCKYFAPAKTWY
jgi:hypothetical protein